MAKETALTVQSMSMPDIAKAFYESGLFPDVRSAAQAIVKIQAGSELGFGPIYSMQKIYIVQGKIVMAAEAMGAKVKQSGRYDYRVTEYTDLKVTLVFTDTGKDVFTSTFTMEDARHAALIKPQSGWEKYPRAMLMSKALSQGARIVCPHLISGAYTPEDFGIETDDEGYITQPQRISEVAAPVVSLTGEVVGSSPTKEAEVKAPTPGQRQAMQGVVQKAGGRAELVRREMAAEDAAQAAAFGAQGSEQKQAAPTPELEGELGKRMVEKAGGNPAAEKVQAGRDPETIKTISQLANACFADFHLQPNDAAKELGITALKDLSIKPPDAYRTIAKSRENKP